METSTMATLLFEPEARKMGLTLRKTDVAVYGVGRDRPAYYARVKEFRVGTLAESNVDIVVAGQGVAGIQGVVGAKLLHQADVEFDLPDGKIRFFTPHDCMGDQVVYWGQAYAVAPLVPVRDDRIMIAVEVNGMRDVAQLDTSASETVLTGTAAASAGVTPRSTGVAAEGHVRGLDSEPVKVFVGDFASFSFGDETIHNAELRIVDLYGIALTDQPQLLLGTDFLRAHRIYVARAQHKVYASYEGGPVFRPPAPPPKP